MELLDKIFQARERIENFARHTPLMNNKNLKREDLQPVRFYKLRGAYNKIVLLSAEEK